MRLFLTFILVIVSLDVALAYPNGAGSCKNGPAVLDASSPHVEDDQYKWTDSGYKISLDGNSLILEADGDGNYFRGFLLRLSDPNGAATGAMKRHDDYKNISQRLDSTGASVGEVATCAEGVVGICHTDRSKKTKMVVKMFLEKQTVYKLGVTVVKQEDEWYFTTIKLGLTAENTTGIITANNTAGIITSSSKNIATKKNSETASPTASSTVATTGTSPPNALSSSPSPAPMTTTTVLGRGSATSGQISGAQSTSGAAHERPVFALAACTLLLMCSILV